MVKKYDKRLPLISLHIPKAGGTSLGSLLRPLATSDFRMLEFYPEIGRLLPLDWNGGNTIIHGHFVRWKGHPVEDICPEATQFTTIIRDPFDCLVSGYAYGLKNNLYWATEQNIDSFIDWWLDTQNAPLLGALPPLGEARTIEEYAENFVLIGTLEHLDKYVEDLGALLSKNIPPPLWENASPWPEYVPGRRKDVRSAFPMDYELYEYVARCTGDE